MRKRKVKHKIEQRICLDCGKLGAEMEVWLDSIECYVYYCDDCYAKMWNEVDEELEKEEKEELGIDEIQVYDSKSKLKLIKM